MSDPPAGGPEAGSAAVSEAPSAFEPQAGMVATGTAIMDPDPGLLHGCPVEDLLGAVVVHCNRDGYYALCSALKADGYDMPIGVTGVDYLTHPGRSLPSPIVAQRFEVVVELLALAARHRVRVRCQVPADDPHVPTLFELWPGTEAHERETYDMYGIRFDNHPDPSRILMPEDWEGHPLRKDYDTGHVPVQFKEAPR